MRQFLEDEEIGDRKPSQFLRHLRSLAGNVVGDGVLRTIWLSRLPTHVQPHLVTRANDTNDQLADIADAIMEATKASPVRITKVASQPTTSTDVQINLQIAQMQVQQQTLMEQIAILHKTIQIMHSRLTETGAEHVPDHDLQIERRQEFAGTTSHSGKPHKNVNHPAAHKNRKTC